MAIRLRNSNGIAIALCAAETEQQEGDIYLDDAQHYALASKFASDWQGETIKWQYKKEWAEMDRHKVRDAKEELEKWLSHEKGMQPQRP